VVIQTLKDTLFADSGITVDALRLDLIHPQVSGNKWFKLKYLLISALSAGKKGMLSFGGAYSNHLVALAFACRENGLESMAIIRGDDPQMSNPSLQQMREYGMKLVFVSREAYRHKEKLTGQYLEKNPEYYYVPEGGQSEDGIKGASEILQPGHNEYTDIICAVGTGTTIAGIIKASATPQKITGICSLKIPDRSENALLNFIKINTVRNNFRLLSDYHFGGYARKNDVLITFMNELYLKENIPTDFVYTGKLFFAVYDLARKKYFAEGSKVLIIHSGGLQGNRSLGKGILKF
jgi:1-aminocyclopropane-1-carboxylate deaminase